MNLKYELQDDSSGATLKEIRKYVEINRWHENEYESAAIWKLYLQNDEVIAVIIGKEEVTSVK